MNALTLLNPLAGGTALPGAFGLPATIPSAAGARLGMFPEAGLNPFDTSGLQSVIAAGDAATQQLVLQCALLLLNLVQNGAKNGQQASGGTDAMGGASGGGGGAAGGGETHGAQGASGGGHAHGSEGSSGNVSASGQLVERQGKQIDSSIAGNFDRMVAAAKQDGVELKIGSGHRSREEQEVLYQKYLNGTGNLAAKPGTSNHESGLAIDFEGTPGAFDWLAKNAEKFGFKNLPGEPWHYSPNGK